MHRYPQGFAGGAPSYQAKCAERELSRPAPVDRLPPLERGGSQVEHFSFPHRFCIRHAGISGTRIQARLKLEDARTTSRTGVKPPNVRAVKLVRAPFPCRSANINQLDSRFLISGSSKAGCHPCARQATVFPRAPGLQHNGKVAAFTTKRRLGVGS